MDNKCGSDLTSIDCVKYQLPDKEIVIGDITRKALRDLTVDQQKWAYLGMRSFFKAAASHLQLKLHLQNEFLRQLGWLNPLRKEKKSTVMSIGSVTSVLQPEINVTEVVDEWKLFQVDNDLTTYNASERIEVFWNGVADELLNEASSKLDDALSSKLLNKTSVTIAKMMLDTAREKHQKAMDSLDNIRKQKKSLDETKHKLI